MTEVLCPDETNTTQHDQDDSDDQTKKLYPHKQPPDCVGAHAGVGFLPRMQMAEDYRYGFTFNRDYVLSYQWYTLASVAGSPTALEQRRIVAESMTPDQIGEAKRLLAQWEPNPAECESIVPQPKAINGSTIE